MGTNGKRVLLAARKDMAAQNAPSEKRTTRRKCESAHIQVAGIQITGVELGVLNGSKLFKNFDGLVSSVETINDFDRGRTSGLKDGYDTFKEYISVGQNFSFFDAITSDTTKIEDIISTIFDNVSKFFAPSDNPYQAYLDSH